MRAYLMSMGLWGQATGLDPIPIEPMDPTKATGKKASPTDDEINAYKAEHATYLVEYKAWSRANQQALGTIVLHCNASIQEDLSQQDLAEDAWSRLKATYGTATPTSTYKDFKEALGIRIRTDSHPGMAIDKMAACFQRLASNKVILPDSIMAMIMLAALPQKWEMLVPVIMQTTELDKLDISDVRDAVISQYETESARHQGGKPNNGKKPHNANKLSAVKRKRGDPSWKNQEKGESQPQGDKPNYQRGKRGGKGKGKGKKPEGAHISHIADVASLPPPASSTVAEIGSSGLHRRTVESSRLPERTEGPYKSLNKALDIAHETDAPATTEVVKTLEQRITQDYMDGPWSKSTHYLSDDEGSDIVDMSVAPAGHDDQDAWDAFQEGSPSFTPASGDEPLDWGSDLDDVEECVSSTSLSSYIHNIPALHQRPKR